MVVIFELVVRMWGVPVGVFFKHSSDDQSNKTIADSIRSSVSNDVAGTMCPDAVAGNSSSRSVALETLFNSVLQTSAGHTSTPRKK